MEKDVIYVVDDGMSTRVAENEADAYYKVIEDVIENDPEAFLMWIQDFLSDREMIHLGKCVDARLANSMVAKYHKI